tara:strand:- start:23252 stop:25981 length:2730 start_codon:yes stop_codon:yes gene_type:complete
MSKEEKKEKVDPKVLEEKRRKAFLRQERTHRNIQQCILSQNIDSVLEFANSREDLFEYRTFRQIKGHTPTIVSSLKGLGDLSCFYNIKSSTLSLLHPKVRLFKVRYTTTDDEGQIIPLSEPTMKEIKFADNFGKQQSASVSSYLASESSQANWRNVGLRSFTLRHIGRDHGGIERNIKCSLSLKFKGLKDLVARPAGQRDIRYVDLVLFPEGKINRQTEEYNPKHYEIRALIGYNIPPESSLRGLGITNKKEIECIKKLENSNIMVSLSLHRHDFSIQADGSVELSADYFGRIETTISSAHANVFQPSLQVKKDGEGDISPTASPESSPVNLGRIKLLLTEANKDLNSEDDVADGESIVARLLKMPSFVKIYEEFSGKKIRNKKGKISSTNAEKVLLDIEDAALVQGLKASVDEKAGALRRTAYRSFMSQLINGAKGDRGTGTRLFCANVPSSKMDEVLGLSNTLAKGAKMTPAGEEEQLKAKEKERIKKQTTAAISDAAESFKVAVCSEILADAAKMADVSKNADEFSRSPSSESAGKDKKDKPVDYNARSLITAAREGERYQFHFIFAGDVIELACKNAGIVQLHEDKKYIFEPKSYWKEQDENSLYSILSGVRILIGPMEYRSRTGKLKHCNLSQFPIAFDTFREWFTNAVIKRDAVTMSLGTFLRKFMNELVLPGMGADCIRPAKPRGTRVENVQVSLPGRQTKSGTREELLPIERVINVDDGFFKAMYKEKAAAAYKSDSAVHKSYDYLLLQLSSIGDIRRRTGTAVSDIKDGIYHFNIGSDRGLLKTMQFSKQDIAGVAEMRSLQSIEAGGDQISQLAFPYDVDLTLVGNTLFTPGMIFYANPTFLGLGSAEDRNSLAYQLNLGGYFLILETEIVIEPGTFETRIINAKTLGHGKMKTKRMTL